MGRSERASSGRSDQRKRGSGILDCVETSVTKREEKKEKMPGAAVWCGRDRGVRCHPLRNLDEEAGAKKSKSRRRDGNAQVWWVWWVWRVWGSSAKRNGRLGARPTIQFRLRLRVPGLAFPKRLARQHALPLPPARRKPSQALSTARPCSLCFPGLRMPQTALAQTQACPHGRESPQEGGRPGRVRPMRHE